jgi:membrane-bound ClpP family serine protease
VQLRSLLFIAGVIALVFGLGFLLVPRPVLALYGVPTDPAIVLMSRFFGVALVQVGLVLYLIRDVSDARTQRGVIIGSFLGSVAGLVVSLTGQFWGIVNQLGWSSVAIYALLTLGYGAFMFGRPTSA